MRVEARKRRAAQELLGHSSVATTQRHTHMNAEDLREQVAGLPASRSNTQRLAR